MNILKIDAHQHFWRYNAAEYGWINDAMPALKQDRMPEDLAPLLQAQGIDGCIAVQARQTLEETQFLVALAKTAPWIFGVVGWLDLTAPDLEDQLANDQTESLIKGYRHLIQDEVNPAEFMSGNAFNTGVDRVLERGLIYELLIHAKDLEAGIAFCDRHDHGIIVLDHLGKPNPLGEPLDQWINRLQPFAAQKHVYCKLSGLITEVGPNWTQDQLIPYIEAALACFGPERLLFGSDWPVCLLAGSYGAVYQLIETALKALTINEQNAILGGNAAKIYQLSQPL